jgi:undecaprenyl-diphosphatase
VNLLSAAVLGVVQGITEFLPVSSTAHLLIASKILGFSDPGGVFTVTIQFGSILAVMWLYRSRIVSLMWGCTSVGPERRFALAILAAFVPAVVAGLLFEGFVKGVLYQSPRVVAGAFIVGGVVMLAVERFRPAPVVHHADRTSVGRAVAIGLCQTLALIPGVSRSGATIVGGMLAGLDRAAAAEFSFFLAMPTIAGAFAKDLWEVRHLLSPERGAEIAVGFLMAFVAAALVVGPFIRFVSRVGFASFAWYRIAAGVALYAAAAAGWAF